MRESASDCAHEAIVSGYREAPVRIELGHSFILFLWTERQYRLEAVRLFQGVNRHLVRLIRARRLLGLCFLLVRRSVQSGPAVVFAARK